MKDRSGLGAPAAPLSRRELNAQVARLRRPDNLTNWSYILREYFYLTFAIGGTLGIYRWITDRGGSWTWILPVYLLAVFFIGAIQHRLSNLTHEAGHYALFRNRYLNELISDLVCIFPLGATTHNYRVSHWGHHAYTNDPDRDPDLIRLLHHQEYRFPMPKSRFLLLYVLLQVFPMQSLRYLWGRAKIAVLGINRGAFAETESVYGPGTTALLRLGYYSAGAFILTWMGWWTYLALFWIVPIVVAYPLWMLLREIAHHTNVPENSTFLNSRVFAANAIETFCIFPYGQAYHLPHHLFPSVPHYRLSEVHRIAMAYPDYGKNVRVCGGFVSGRRKDRATVLELLTKPVWAVEKG